MKLILWVIIKYFFPLAIIIIYQLNFDLFNISLAQGSYDDHVGIHPYAWALDFVFCLFILLQGCLPPVMINLLFRVALLGNIFQQIIHPYKGNY